MFFEEEEDKIKDEENEENLKEKRDSLLIKYFTRLIQEGKASATKRSLTIEVINRYIFCLNKVYNQGMISLVELRNDIKNELEKNKGFEIDKKTLKKIIDNLKIDNLVKIVNFLVTITQADGQGSQNMVKTLVLEPDFEASDD